MRRVLTPLVIVATVCWLTALSGCIYDELNSQWIVEENVCVNIEDIATSEDLSARVVCDLFRQRLMDRLFEEGLTLDDVESVSLVSGRYKLVTMKGHDWTVDGMVRLSRQDDPGNPPTEGPVPFVEFDDQSIHALKGTFTPAVMESEGVDLLNDALADILEGGDPRVVLDLDDIVITPAPTEQDPMEFKFLACVRVQAIIND